MTIPRPQDILNLAQEITRLEAQLAEAKRKWDALFGIDIPAKKTRSASPNSLTTRVFNFVEEKKGIELSISAVAEGLKEPELAIGRVLYRLGMLGKIANPARGRYRSLEKEVPSEEKTS